MRDIKDYLEQTNTVLLTKDAFEHLKERASALDKIRAEIKTKYDSIPWRNNDYDDGWIEALEWVFDDVLDKYKAESEGKK